MATQGDDRPRDHLAALRRLSGRLDLLETKLQQAERELARLQARVDALDAEVDALRTGGAGVGGITVTRALGWAIGVLAAAVLLRAVV